MSKSELCSSLLVAIESTLAHAFGEAWRVQVRGYANYMLFAVRDGKPRLDRLDDLPRNAGDEREKLRKIAEVVRAATAEAKPLANLCLTDDHAPVERLMDRSIQRESRLILGD